MKLFSENIKKGNKYDDTKEFKQINLNNFHTNGNLLSNYYLADPTSGEVYLKSFSFYDLDIEKCLELFYNLDKEEITDVIRWGAFLVCTKLNDLSLILGNMLEEDVKTELIRKVREINMNDDGTLTKEEAEDWGRWIEQNIRADALEEGKTLGLEEGLKIGTINTVKSMLENKLDYNIISKVTNKSIEEIKEIEKTIEK